MSKNILVPGAGGFAAVNFIKSIRMTSRNARIISTDSNHLSAGFYLSDEYHVVPRADDPRFIDKALDIIDRENVDFIVPTSGFDLIPYAKNKGKIEKTGAKLLFSNYETLNMCQDKAIFYNSIKESFDTPTMHNNPAVIDDFPVFVKPRFGKGSKDTHICNSHQEVTEVLSDDKEMIIQEYLPGVEYTIDVLSDLEGNPIFAVPRIRIETKAGISFKGRIVLNKDLQSKCLRLADFLKIKGPSCMQMKEDRQGQFKFIEVNPRMGGGTIFSTLAGANIPEYLLLLANGEKIETPNLEEITVLRYYEEVIAENE